MTIDDKFPLLNVGSILKKLERTHYVTTIALAKGYHQILIREQDRVCTNPFGTNPFGLKDAHATF